MTSLSPLWVPRLRAQPQPAKTAPVSVPSVFAPAKVTPANVSAPTMPAEVQRCIAIETLTVADVTDLSVSTINALVPHRPDLVAELIVNSGKRRRAELPMNPSTLRPMARAILLSGELRRGRELNEEERDFMASFLESIGA
jgi:hypothetical protein